MRRRPESPKRVILPTSQWSSMKHRILPSLALLALGLLCTLPFVPASSQQAPDPQQHPRHRAEDRPRADQAAARPRAQARRARAKRWPRKASTTASTSIASSRASWPRPAIRKAPAAAAPSTPTCRPSSPRSASSAAASARRAPTIPTAPTASSSSASACSCGQLTGQYTLWGEVIEGMEHVDKIAPGEPPRVARRDAEGVPAGEQEVRE